MATFTVTADKNIDEYASKAGGDTYTINGGVLRIDQDSRYGLNQNTSSILGPITISSSLGGVVEVDSRFVRLIPYNSGTGNVPAAGTVISQGGVTGKLIGVWSAINVAPTAAGSAMPTTGFIKVKQVSQVPGYSAGALTGIGATATGEDIAGWIELVGQESSTINVPRLGLFRMRGDWFEVGSTTGDNTSTYQLPTNGSTFYAPGVFVHNGKSGDTDANYEFYPCAGSLVASASVGTDAVRGKVCWISTAGVLRFGHDGTNANTGYTPPAGRKIRLPNIICHNATSAAKTANARPNATLGTRYDFTTTSGGAISISKATLGWYPSFTSAYSLNLESVGISEAIYIASIPTPISLLRVGTGQCAAQANRTFQMNNCFAGGEITDCVWSRASNSGDMITYQQSIRGFTMTRVKQFCFVGRQYTDYISVGQDLTYIDCTWGCGVTNNSSMRNVKYINPTYFSVITGTTVTGAPSYAFNANGTDCVFDGLNFGGLTNVHPYAEIITVNGTGTSGITIQNTGSYANPLDCGTVNACAGLVAYTNGGLENIRLRRNYLANNRADPFGGNSNSLSDVLIENCFGSASTTSMFQISDATLRGLGVPLSRAALSAYYSSTWLDGFNSTTVGWLVLRFNEPSARFAPYVTLSGTAAFNGAGGLVLPTVGDTATFELPYFAIGHTGFSNVTAPVMDGGTITNYSFAFQADTGSGWSSWSSEYATADALRDALSTLNIAYATGFKLRLRLTATTASTTAITFLVFTTTTTETAQQTLYPLEVATVSVDGLVTGSMVKASKVSDGSILFTGAESSGVISFTTDYAGAVAIEARKASSSPYYRPWSSQVTTVLGSTVSATAVQQLDE